MENGVHSRAGLLETWVRLLRRRWPAGVLAFLFVVLATVWTVFFTTPIHRADARLRLGEPPPAGGVSPTTGFIGLLRLGGDPFANDLELIRSRTLAEQVTQDAALNVKLGAPRGWTRDSLFTRLTASRLTDKTTFEVAWNGDEGIVVRQIAPVDSTIGHTAPGAPLSFGGIEVVFRVWREGMPRSVTLATLPFDDAARGVSGRIEAERTRREANVLDLSFDNADPRVAHQALLSVVRRFTAMRTDILRRESGETVDSLREVVRATQLELRNAEDALEGWQRETLLIAPDAQGEAFVERYSEAAALLEMARLERSAMDSVLARLERAQGTSDVWTTLLAQPQFLQNENVVSVLSRLGDLESQRAELRTRRAETSREMRVLSDQIAALDSSLRALARENRLTLEERAQDLMRQVHAMETELAGMPSHTVELARRQRSVRVLTEVVVLTEQRLRQEEIRQALTVANVQIIDPPALRRKPVWPRKTISLAAGLLLAVMFAGVALSVAEAADPTARRGADIRTLLGAPVLAAVRRNANLSAQQAAGIRTRARGAARIVVAPIGPLEVQRLVESLGGAGADPPVVTGDALIEFGAASAAVPGAVVIVIEAGRTRRRDVERAALMLREAGAGTPAARVIGAIVVARRAADVRAANE
jgi:uncharacterized protein involved in exopolysaccharide biosynthesis